MEIILGAIFLLLFGWLVLPILALIILWGWIERKLWPETATEKNGETKRTAGIGSTSGGGSSFGC